MERQQFNLLIQQPTVPHYRVPFFDALSQRYPESMTVCGSRHVGNGPPSAEVVRNYLNLSYPCQQWLENRIYWQKGLSVNRSILPGDVAVLSGNPRFLSTFKLAMAARRKKMGLVWWGHGWSPTSSKLAISARRGLMRQMDSVLFYSDLEAATWRPHLPNDIGVFGAQNAIDQTVSNAQRARWNQNALHEFQLKNGLQGRKVMLFCGRLRTNPHTDLDLLFEALVYLSSIDQSYMAVIIGDGDDRQRLGRIAEKLGVSQHVIWLGAKYNESEIAPWFLSSKCFVYPGPIGLSILHAMGYGLPVLTHSNRKRHNPEIVTLRDEENGLMFRDGDARHLADQLLRLSTNDCFRAKLSANALRTAHEEFTLERMVERFCAAVSHARQRVLRTTGRQVIN